MSAPVLLECAAAGALRSAWESLLLALFTAMLFRFLPRLSPGRRFAAAASAFVLAAALPFFPAPAVHAGSHTSAGAAIALPMEAAPVLAGLWLAASSALLLRLMFSACSLAALLRRAEPAPPAVDALYRRIANGRARRAKLLLAEGLSAPSACGLLRPAVLLPRALPGLLSQDELAAILRHEAAHLNGGDDWLALGLRLTRALLPFAFGLPMLERRLLAAREMLCDDAALGGPANAAPSRKSYAACLASFARPNPRRTNGLAPGLGGSELSLRIGRILSPEQGGSPGRLRLAAAALAGSALCLSLLAAPAVFSFEPEAGRPALAQLSPPPPSLPGAQLRLASLQAAPPTAPKRRAVRRRRFAPAQRPFALGAVTWTAPAPRVVILIPAAQVLPASGWTRFFLLSI